MVENGKEKMEERNRTNCAPERQRNVKLECNEMKNNTNMNIFKKLKMLSIMLDLIEAFELVVTHVLMIQWYQDTYDK